MTFRKLLLLQCKPSVFTRYLDPDMYSMMEDNSDSITSKKFKKLTKAICELVRRFKTDFNLHPFIRVFTSNWQ